MLVKFIKIEYYKMVLRCVMCGLSREMCITANTISFHKFPMDRVRREKWCSAMELSVEKIFKNSVLCRLHFDKDCFVHSSDPRDTFRKRLKLDAVPSIRNIFHNEIEGKNEANVTKNNECVVKTEPQILEENKLISDKYIKMEINVDSEQSESNENVTKVITEGTSFNCISLNENKILKRSQDFDTHIQFSGRLKKITNIKWDDISHSLPLCKIYFEEAQDVIADLEKKLRSKGHRTWRLEKRVKSLKSMLQVMKNRKLLTEEMATKLKKNTSPVVASVIR
ncbi:uncharacterized protein LOC107269891 [Cephus cinctus]|uniref:Uncharacterized protein LOC107269891 n=1 Tax=Cephus cinctus TaxID=211228 RepID=A0AAJ7C1Q7_CEPCN|nr:uncharacterized protein LOC107269891 [Cephus cinctus]